jgi:hypothetical protein
MRSPRGRLLNAYGKLLARLRLAAWKIRIGRRLARPLLSALEPLCKGSYVELDSLWLLWIW